MKLYFVGLLLAVGTGCLSQNTGLTLSSADDNYLVVPDDPAMNLTTDFSIEFWINPLDISFPEIILTEGVCTGLFSYNLRIDSDSLLMFAADCTGDCSSDAIYKCGTKIQPNQCLHVALVYSNTDIKVYFDAVLQTGFYTLGSFCGPVTSSPQDLTIGAYPTLSGGYSTFCDALIDELRIWSKELTPTEIMDNYQSELVGDETDLVLYYNFNDPIAGPGEIVSNNAVVTGSALDGQTFSLLSSSPLTDADTCFTIGIGFDELFGTNIKVYPNPTKGIIHIDIIGLYDDIKLTVLDAKGSVVYLDNLTQSSFDIDLSDLDRGIYTIRFQARNKVVTKKISVM
ncbi:T9SS type A sorting domain-containing protein [Crocinitomix catalasitica]|nr:T9SS type A sorting domain-containing protein [Crocinitomix catalasitica]